eukprot:gene60727-biopygen44012
MACSVYAAQYLLEGLFEHGGATAALELMIAPGDRSWRHMVNSGTTITWEAWDQKYKPNQDWNHAWGAAPANLLSRYVLGARPLTPGWHSIRLRPHPGALTSAAGKIPTPRGAVEVSWKKAATFTLTFTVPPKTTARLDVPVTGAGQVFVDGRRVTATQSGDWLLLADELTGTHTVEVR